MTVPVADVWGSGAHVVIYEVSHGFPDGSPPLTFYFACETCGNCSLHWGGRRKVMQLAKDHVLNVDHTDYEHEGWDDDDTA